MSEGNQEPENAFRYVIKVGIDDIDALQHVNNVVYLRYVQEVAQAHWDTIASDEMKKKYSWVVLRHEIDYKNPAFLGDELIARTWVSSCEGVRSVRNVKLYQSTSGKLVAETKTFWCLLDAQTMRPKRIEQDIIEVFSCHL
jgi:acyl-CoA thioester hydrolase